MWGEATDWSAARVLAMGDEDAKGAFLCVDLEYNDYPLCPERMNIPRKWLSPYQEQLVGKHYSDCEKLVPNLRDKSKY